MCPPTWTVDFIRPLIRIDYTSLQSLQATLSVAEPVSTAKVLQKKSKLSEHFPLCEQISKKYFEVMK